MTRKIYIIFYHTSSKMKEEKKTRANTHTLHISHTMKKNWERDFLRTHNPWRWDSADRITTVWMCRRARFTFDGKLKSQNCSISFAAQLNRRNGDGKCDNVTMKEFRIWKMHCSHDA